MFSFSDRLQILLKQLIVYLSFEIDDSSDVKASWKSSKGSSFSVMTAKNLHLLALVAQERRRLRCSSHIL